jgi:curved DNA-binding protein
MKDYYQILGVQKDATDDQIKKAYRKLASQHHPDKGGDTAKFQEIQEAYATLSDPQKRAQHDNPQPDFGNMGGMPPGFEDLFRSGAFDGFFGGGGNPFFGGGFRQARQPQRNQDMSLETTISLTEAYTGKEVMATVTLPSGREQVLEIKIPAGIQSGQKLRLQGMGDDRHQHLPRGDMYLNVRILIDPRYERRGDDLYRNIRISAWDAMLGKEIVLDSIDGRELNVTIPAGSQPNGVLRLTGYGMPNVNDPRFKGNLMLNLEITIPKNLTESQKDLIKQIMN